jgi:hypothetical protein
MSVQQAAMAAVIQLTMPIARDRAGSSQRLWHRLRPRAHHDFD